MSNKVHAFCTWDQLVGGFLEPWIEKDSEAEIPWAKHSRGACVL